jgi:hypothetical protein
MPGPPAPFIPTPLPNIGKSGLSPKGYSKKVEIEGSKVAIKGATFKSMGDIASQGTGGGIVSNNCEGPTAFVGPGSMDVKIEGNNVQLLSDPMLNNNGPSGNPPNAATMAGVIQACGTVIAVEAGKCPVCNKDHGDLKETPATKLDAQELSNKFHALVVERVSEFSTMLGVVQCGTCSKKYGDHSSGTLQEFVQAAGNAGILTPAATGSLAEGTDTSAREENVEAVLKARLGEDKGANLADKARTRFRKSRQKKGPTAYPIGSCAAQGALLCAMDAGAISKAMTERFYHFPGGTTAPIVHDVVNSDGVRIKNVEREFRSGETVPPCKTCELIVPILLCPDPETKCSCPK